MPAAVLHDPCQAGQQTPLTAERQEPVHVTVLVAFMWPALLPDMVGNGPYWCCACRAWSCKNQDHKHRYCCVCAGLCVGLKKEHVLRWGKPPDSQAPSPNPQLHTQPCNQMLSLKAQQPGSERTSCYGYSSTNLASRCPASNLQPSPRPQAIAYSYVNVNVWRWGRRMLGAQRANLDSDELHAGAPLQPMLGATPQHGPD
jgi:hypothetical protein